jgi:prepilin-type N-terminal cleavage/methylation domain-containing protein
MSRRGFTLIEILAVVAIASILLSLGLPRIGPALDRARVNSAANVMAGDLQYAQMMAVRNRRPVALVVTTSTKQYIIRDRDDSSIIYRTRFLGTESEFGIAILTASPTTNETFPNGLARASATYTLTLNGYTRTVTFSRAGQVRIS